MFRGAQPVRNGMAWKTKLEPYEGPAQTVRKMAMLAAHGQSNPAIRRHAVAVVRRVPPRDYLSELAALYYDVCRRVRYVRDPIHVEHVQHPLLTLRNRQGDCDDMAIALASIIQKRRVRALGAAAMSIGNEIEFVLVGFRAGGGPTHVYVRVRNPSGGGYIALDPVAGPLVTKMLRAVRTRKVIGFA